MTSSSSTNLHDQLSKEMESTVDSNSESDISENWAVIDEDSSLEWNNEIKYGFRRQSPSLRNDQSDEESIEVVLEDPDKYVEDPNIIPTLSPLKEEADNSVGSSKEDIRTDTPFPHHPEEGDQEKKNLHISLMQEHPILMGFIIGVITLGSIWILYPVKLGTSSNPSGLELVSKLQHENQFLRSELRYVYSSLRSALARTNAVRPNSQPEEKFSYSNHYFATSSIQDFVLGLQENSEKDYCLPSEGPNMTNSVLNTANTNTNPVSIKKADNAPIILSKIKTVAHSANEQFTVPWEIFVTSDSTMQENENKSYVGDTVSNLKLNNHILENNFIDDSTLEIPSIGMKTGEFASKADDYLFYDESLSDPRPLTKLRYGVEKIYTIANFLGEESRMTLPLKSHLLNTFAQNVEVLGTSLGSSIETDNAISNFKAEIQNSTQMLVDFIDHSINKLVESIAVQIKESQNKIQNQFCGLKTNFELYNIALLNWQGKPIFQDCSEFRKIKTEDYGRNMEDYLKSVSNLDIGEYLHNAKEDTGNQPLIQTVKKNLHSTSDINHHGKHSSGVKNVNKRGRDHAVLENSDNVDQDSKVKTSEQNAKLKKNKRSSSKEDRKKDQYKLKNSKNKKSKEMNEESKPKYSESKLRSKKSKGEKASKDPKNSDKRKKNHKKEKYFEYNLKNEKISKSHKRAKDSKNISGDWTIKLANGRAEQRRRDKKSDWVFDRAQSRNMNREKGKNEKREACWFHGQEYNQ